MSVRGGLLLWSLLVLAGLVGVSAWATGIVSIVPAIQDLLQNPAAGYNPWTIATLFDAYFGFLWFWLWIAYRERSLAARIAWLPAVLLLGNIAMACYMLKVLWSLPPGAGVRELLLRPGSA
ncbi:DUF1475 domain-containing protein [Solimonas fluminis]|uniref:DUF1475 domain-containing protein n=1 Tax=Solimonas fluminis TaxID=2086571 RepID=A0A2S5TJ61_9GAMM|nr:DUF1475 family protein [Solimonas fluminis]PPE75001.1 DUF1475 domain-containing protein [Solimonas fluminis]